MTKRGEPGSALTDDQFALGRHTARAAAMPPPASRARRVAEARRDVLSSMVPEGAEDNVDALQRAAERLEADAARTRRDLLVAASRVLGDPEGSHYVSVADSDARDARVVAALVDIVPRGGATERATPGDAGGDAGGGLADAREKGTAGGTETSRSGAPPAWAATSDAATREEDTALADAAAALREARSRRDVATALAARRKQAGLSASAAEDADARLRRGDLAGAAAAAAAAAGAAADLRRALAEDRDGRGRGSSWDARSASELDRETAALTSAAEDLAGRIRDAVERTFRSAARAEEDADADAADSDGGRRFVVDPEALESVWLAFSSSTASTETNEASSASSPEKSAVLPPDFVSRCLQTLNDELAMELFLPLADAAAEDGALVSATVEVRNAREVVFAWRAVEISRDDADETAGVATDKNFCPSREKDASERCAVALATALTRALDFVGQHVRLAGRPGFAKETLGSTWEAVAAATQSRWFDDDESKTRLGDDAVAGLCAAESVAASLGASPAPPAAGPVELAAFERERRAAETIVAAALEEAARVVEEGERDRATARAGTTANDGEVGAGSAESVADAAFFSYRKVSERDARHETDAEGKTPLPTETPVTMTRPNKQNPTVPRLPFPKCAVSVSAARLSGLVAATLWRASSTRRRVAEGFLKNVSPALLRALETEAETTERTACDILEYWRAVVPALRRPENGEPDAAAAIAAGGYAAAATFRNDAYFLCSRFCAAAYAFSFDSSAEEGDVSLGDVPSLNKNEHARPRQHPNVLWVVPPLLRLGDSTLDALVLEASRVIASETAVFGACFARGLDRRDDADEATRAVRRARRCLGSAIFALHERLPEPVARTHVASLLRRYANDVLGRVFALTDVSSDACDAARDTLREAFAEEGVLPFDGAHSSAPLEARREASKNQFAAILEKAPSDCGELWRKGRAASLLFDASLGDIGDGIEDGRWFRLGFEPGEIRALLLAVFEDSHRRREVLEMLA